MEYLSYAVNLDAIATIETLDSGDTRLAMKDGSTEPCSRRYRAGLRGRAGATMQEPGQPGAAS